VRRWALEHPAEYALLYGTPVPGYTAPPDTALLAGLAAWSQLFGLVGFEVFGRLADMFEDPATHFDHQMQTMADLAGLP
jgi:hypothetical protein